MRRSWGTGAALEQLAPSVAGDARLRRWLGRSQRLVCTVDEISWRNEAAFAVDMRLALGSVQAPILFVYRHGLRDAALIADDGQHVKDQGRGAAWRGLLVLCRL